MGEDEAALQSFIDKHLKYVEDVCLKRVESQFNIPLQILKQINFSKKFEIEQLSIQS